MPFIFVLAIVFYSSILNCFFLFSSPFRCIWITTQLIFIFIATPGFKITAKSEFSIFSSDTGINWVSSSEISNILLIGLSGLRSCKMAPGIINADFSRASSLTPLCHLNSSPDDHGQQSRIQNSPRLNQITFVIVHHRAPRVLRANYFDLFKFTFID